MVPQSSLSEVRSDHPICSTLSLTGELAGARRRSSDGTAHAVEVDRVVFVRSVFAWESVALSAGAAAAHGAIFGAELMLGGLSACGAGVVAVDVRVSLRLPAFFLLNTKQHHHLLQVRLHDLLLLLHCFDVILHAGAAIIDVVKLILDGEERVPDGSVESGLRASIELNGRKRAGEVRKRRVHGWRSRDRDPEATLQCSEHVGNIAKKGCGLECVRFVR